MQGVLATVARGSGACGRSREDMYGRATRQNSSLGASEKLLPQSVYFSASFRVQMPRMLDVAISMWDDRSTIDGVCVASAIFPHFIFMCLQICRLLTFAFPLAADRLNSRPFTQQALRTLTGQM